MLSQRELESRYEVYLEQYVTKINIEAETAAAIARTMLLPAAARHLALLLEAQLTELAGESSELIEEFATAIRASRRPICPRTSRTATCSSTPSTCATRGCGDGATRAAADKLEKVVADDLWPLPKYSEILFIK